MIIRVVQTVLEGLQQLLDGMFLTSCHQYTSTQVACALRSCVVVIPTGGEHKRTVASGWEEVGV